MSPLAGAAISPLVFWAIAIGFWIFGRLRDKARERDGGASRGEGAARPRATPASGDDDALPAEAEALERWLREKIGGATVQQPLPAPVARRPAPKAPEGPMGRRAPRALPSHEAIEDGTSLEVEREVVDYDTQIVERTAPPIVDLDTESAFAAQRRILQAERRSKAHAAADHDAFHDRISAPDAHAAQLEAVRAQRRSALRAAWITSEVLAPPISSRRTS